MQTPPILVTGGTGRLGSLVTPLLQDAGHDVRVLSRRDHASGVGIEYVTGDLLEDDGIDAAVDGVETILHLAGGANGKGDEQATRNLMRAATGAGVRHVVNISVVGADRMPLGYFRNKLGAEQAVVDSGLPWTTIRVAQVNDLVLTMVQAMAKLPVIPAPSAIRFQPVDAADVADRLAELALDKPAGLVPDLAGPQVYGMGELVRGYLRARGKRRLLMPVRIPGKVGRAYRAGENLTLDGADLAKRTWDDFLAARVTASA